MSHPAAISLGYTLTDSGLHELLVIVYANNVVIRILCGARHLLVCFENLRINKNRRIKTDCTQRDHGFDPASMPKDRTN